MPGLTATQIIQVWEQGQYQHPVERALTMLAAALPEIPRNEIAGWSIGQRDLRLMELRGLTWGDRLDAYAKCPECYEALEIPLSINQFRQDVPSCQSASFELTFDRFELSCRLPNSMDLSAATHAADARDARLMLMRRCIGEVRFDGKPVSPDKLPRAASQVIAESIHARDPAAFIELNLDCPECQAHWTRRFDIVSFFWLEIRHAARQLLGQIHALASAYGWSESEVLSLGEARRRHYLGLVG